MDDNDDGYDDPKTFYRLIDVAIRWSGLSALKSQIIKATEGQNFGPYRLQKWPSLQKKVDVLWDAMRNNELPYGCMGITVPPDEDVKTALLTLRHAHLKSWFTTYHPSEKPKFLFPDAEFHAVTRLSVEAYKALIVELDIARLERERHQAKVINMTVEIERLQQENAVLQRRLRNEDKPGRRGDLSNLRLIAAFLTLLLGKSPSGKPYSSFASQASIISILTVQNPGKPGFNKRTLEEKFAAANRSNENTK
ncbi:hypothetical protein ALQ33_01557 [Pseudomonas syringae pv. philadelphi]|uniref:Uncharacterized protein n=1 Tax=Pseudomonas syringae pv. philadelphi TaxID=251706 RepID=A0A3M3YK60_9PSED|nr:hypothetical protein [Pseudomonas syringae group genomosp. 3]RMO82912.1 hypothetical protein ALQ33_01557 [Pseudomonas syringae pv. philadelphi]